MSDSAVLDRLTYLEETLEIPEFQGVRYIAKKMNVSGPYLRARPWLLPNWGESDVPGKRSWRLKTIRAWLDEMTPAQRQDQWDSLPPSAKKARQLKWGAQ